MDQGNLDCHKRFSPDAQNTYLKTYIPGESFGELALLYNAPRAATITSKDNSICFSLDRACFNHIVKDAAIKKRERFDEFLQRVNILDSLDKYERGKICDCLQTVTYKKGDFVIREGDSGNTFYFIQKGKAEALMLFIAMRLMIISGN
jgi:cAMP-dependent protein kinase regulator